MAKMGNKALFPTCFPLVSLLLQLVSLLLQLVIKDDKESIGKKPVYQPCTRLYQT